MSYDRRGRMLGAISLPHAEGLEIGALNSPLVRKSESKIRYVDYATTEIVKADLISRGIDRYRDMVSIDIVWGGKPLAEVVNGKVDYVIASHVIEHVPDLIGWLQELHGVLKPGGTLGLAVPDRNHTFDIRRNDSTPAEMVEAYLLGYKMPSLRQVFDAAAFSRNGEEKSPWRCDHRKGDVPAEVIDRLPKAFELVKDLARNPRYNDAHCWVFTPTSFLDSAEALLSMKLFNFVIADFYPTEAGTNEFQVRLLAVGPSQTADIAHSIRMARRKLKQSENQSRSGLFKARINRMLSRVFRRAG